jgi:LemA protein
MNVMPVAGLGVAILVLAGFATLFNRFIRSRNRVREAWSGIDVQLKRRHDLVSRLVECVKGYREHERGVLEQVSHARSDAIQARGVEQTGQAETELARNLRHLVAVAEAYPDLKASESFRQLSGALVELEDQLQYARRYYNGAVRDFNTLVESFPSNLVAWLAGFRVQPFFSIESATERQAPEVTL